MSLIIAGTVRVPPQNIEGARPHMKAMLEASRAEPGCLAYSYAEDVLEPGLIRVFETWRDQAALDLHFASEHMAAWRAAWTGFGATDRALTIYEVSGEKPL